MDYYMGNVMFLSSLAQRLPAKGRDPHVGWCGEGLLITATYPISIICWSSYVIQTPCHVTTSTQRNFLGIPSFSTTFRSISAFSLVEL